MEDFETTVTLPMLGDDTDTSEFNVKFDFILHPGDFAWGDNYSPNIYELINVQLEISDGIFAVLPEEHYHLIQDACDEICDDYYKYKLWGEG